jgi:hypothetical protein
VIYDMYMTCIIHDGADRSLLCIYTIKVNLFSASGVIVERGKVIVLPHSLSGTRRCANSHIDIFKYFKMKKNHNMIFSR